MSILRFELAKTERYFYVSSYRKTIRVLLVSIIFNFLLLTLISYIHFNQPRASYYGTNGRMSPVLLSPINQPNTGAQALLADDVATDGQPVTNL
jgi:hypothetical protein